MSYTVNDNLVGVYVFRSTKELFVDVLQKNLKQLLSRVFYMNTLVKSREN